MTMLPTHPINPDICIFPCEAEFLHQFPLIFIKQFHESWGGNPDIQGCQDKNIVDHSPDASGDRFGKKMLAGSHRKGLGKIAFVGKQVSVEPHDNDNGCTKSNSCDQERIHHDRKTEQEAVGISGQVDLPGDKNS